jgi:hypothetical protein
MMTEMMILSTALSEMMPTVVQLYRCEDLRDPDAVLRERGLLDLDLAVLVHDWHYLPDDRLPVLEAALLA